MLHLLRSNPAFFYLFLSQFLGAFNDNFFKNALIMFITFKLSQSPEQTGLLITLAAGLFILPFFLFSSLAGQLADRYTKTELIKKINLAEVLVMLLGAMSLLNQQIELLLMTLFLMGTQSTFFGPLKYSVLPEMLDKQSLMQGNALFSGSTFVAILLGSILGAVGILIEDGVQIMAVSLIVVSILGYGLSLLISPTVAQNKDLQVNVNIFKSTWKTIALCRPYQSAFFAVLAISWFWFLGALLLSQIPAFVKYDLKADDSVVVAFLSVFTMGIALGSAMVTRWFKGQIVLNRHGLFLGGMSFCLGLIVLLIDIGSVAQINNQEALMDLTTFLTVWPMNAVLLLFLLIAILGGAYIVPLYTLLQTQTPLKLRARMVAVNNIMNALFMVLSSVLIMIGYALSLSLMTMLLLLAVFNVLVAFMVQHTQKNLNSLNR